MSIQIKPLRMLKAPIRRRHLQYELEEKVYLAHWSLVSTTTISSLQPRERDRSSSPPQPRSPPFHSIKPPDPLLRNAGLAVLVLCGGGGSRANAGQVGDGVDATLNSGGGARATGGGQVGHAGCTKGQMGILVKEVMIRGLTYCRGA
jgi:hypothetical protein